MRHAVMLLLAGCGRIGFDPIGATDDGGDGDGMTATPGLIGWWKLDEGNGSVAADSAGSADGPLMAGATTPPSWIAGRVGPSALRFAGDGDGVEIGSAPVFANLPAVTIAVWISPLVLPSTAGDPCLVDRRDASATVGWALGQSGSNQGGFAFGDRFTTGSTVRRSSAAGLLQVGQWSHLAATWDGGSASTGIRLYLDGVEVAYGTASNATATRSDDSTAGLSMSCGQSNAIAVQLDDARIFDRVLSPSEVQLLYDATK